jgi:predicted NBD/HSP70 family sugar kinase
MHLSKGVYNRRLVLAVLYHQGPASRVEISRATGFPPPAVTLICRDLLRQGLIRASRSARPRGTGPGRKDAPLEVPLDRFGVICLTYDRDYIEATVMNLRGDLLWARRWEVRFEGGKATFLNRLVMAARMALRKSPLPRANLIALGTGEPGLVDRARGRSVRAASMPGWEDIPVAEILRQASGLPVMVERGDGLQALGEAAFGAGRGAQHVILVALYPTGVGGGVVEGGRLLCGRDGSAGEIGHLRVSKGGPLCRCGLRGCLEAHLTARWLLQKLDRTPQAGWRTLDSLFQRARAGDLTCRKGVELVAELLAQALGNAVNLLNPERIVLGGQWVQAGDAFLGPVRRAIARYAFPEMVHGLEIRLAEKGDVAIPLGVVAWIREAILAFPYPELGRASIVPRASLVRANVASSFPALAALRRRGGPASG